jgi:hypothetical protein
MIEDKRVPLEFLILFQEQASGGVRDEYQGFAFGLAVQRIVNVPSSAVSDFRDGCSPSTSADNRMIPPWINLSLPSAQAVHQPVWPVHRTGDFITQQRRGEYLLLGRTRAAESSHCNLH